MVLTQVGADLFACVFSLLLWLLTEGKTSVALARWLSWLQCHPIHQEVTGLVPSQGTYLGCGFDLQPGHVREATDWCSITHQCFSLLFSLSQINKHILK